VNVNWMRKAKCSGVMNVEFFPEKSVTAHRARAFCGNCPVKAPCLEYAIINNLNDGVWGGTTPMMRRAIRRKRGLVGGPR
jgi:WhiB family redox-sensing transcriptional regulator